jgi:hypothetical protein
MISLYEVWNYILLKIANISTTVEALHLNISLPSTENRISASRQNGIITGMLIGKAGCFLY